MSNFQKDLTETCYSYAEWWPVLVIRAYRDGNGKWMEDREYEYHTDSGEKIRIWAGGDEAPCSGTHRLIPRHLVEAYQRAVDKLIEVQVQIDEYTGESR